MATLWARIFGSSEPDTDRIEAVSRQITEQVGAELRNLNESLKVLQMIKDGSGVSTTVTEQSAISLTALWRSVRLLQDTFASLPFHIYQETETDRTRVANHPISNLFRYQPSIGLNAYDWRGLAMGKLLLHGNFYAYIERDNRFRPIELIPILSKVDVVQVDGELFYTFEIEAEQYKAIPARDVFHLRGYTTDGIKGKSVLTAHRETLGIGLGAQKASEQFYKKGAKIDGILTTDSVLKPDSVVRIKEQFNKRLAEGERVPLLDNGLKFQAVQLSPQDAEYIQTRKFTELDIARIFGIPPHMIGVMDRATWNNVELLGIEFSKFTMLPICINWEQEISAKLLTEQEKGTGYYPKFSLEGLMRADILTRFRTYEIAIKNGLKSPNECRALEDMNPYEGGDVYMVQTNNLSNIQTINDTDNGQQ